MIEKLQDAVREFFEMTGEAKRCVGVGEMPAAFALACRSGVIREEFEEFTNAMLPVLYDLTRGHRPTMAARAKVADALCDLIYSSVGTGLIWGFDLDAMLREVHRANMTKGKLTSFGRVEKPPGFQHPDLAPFVRGPRDAED